MSPQPISVTCLHVRDGTKAESVLSEPAADILAYGEDGRVAGVVTEVQLCRRRAKRGAPKTMFAAGTKAPVTMTMPEPFIAREAKTDGEIIAGPWATEQDCALELWGKWPALRCTPKTFQENGGTPRPCLLIWPTPETGLPTVMVVGPGFRKEIWNRRARS